MFLDFAGGSKYFSMLQKGILIPFGAETKEGK
jgi:hypothetical protein